MAKFQALGAVDVAPEQYKELANCIEALLTGQSQPFSPDPQVEKHPRKAADKIRLRHGTEPPPGPVAAASDIDQNRYQAVDVASMQAGQWRSLGPEYVCHKIWSELKFNELLLSKGISEHVLPLLQALVVGRLVSIGSEVHNWNWTNVKARFMN